jgi:hypothetical protein
MVITSNNGENDFMCFYPRFYLGISLNISHTIGSEPEDGI